MYLSVCRPVWLSPPPSVNLLLMGISFISLENSKTLLELRLINLCRLNVCNHQSNFELLERFMILLVPPSRPSYASPSSCCLSALSFVWTLPLWHLAHPFRVVHCLGSLCGCPAPPQSSNNTHHAHISTPTPACPAFPLRRSGHT